jgi:hypothetical protein
MAEDHLVFASSPVLRTLLGIGCLLIGAASLLAAFAGPVGILLGVPIAAYLARAAYDVLFRYPYRVVVSKHGAIGFRSVLRQRWMSAASAYSIRARSRWTPGVDIDTVITFEGGSAVLTSRRMADLCSYLDPRGSVGWSTSP